MYILYILHIYIIYIRYVYIYIYIFFKAVVIIMCDFFQVIKNIFLLCKYFAAISVASSVAFLLWHFGSFFCIFIYLN